MSCKFSLFFFLIPLYISQIYGVFINKVLQYYNKNDHTLSKTESMHLCTIVYLETALTLIILFVETFVKETRESLNMF
jgi:hypothetical protein